MFCILWFSLSLFTLSVFSRRSERVNENISSSSPEYMFSLSFWSPLPLPLPLSLSHPIFLSLFLPLLNISLSMSFSPFISILVFLNLLLYIPLSSYKLSMHKAPAGSTSTETLKFFLQKILSFFCCRSL